MFYLHHFPEEVLAIGTERVGIYQGTRGFGPPPNYHFTVPSIVFNGYKDKDKYGGKEEEKIGPIMKDAKITTSCSSVSLTGNIIFHTFPYGQ